MIRPYTWALYSRKLQARIDKPHSLGEITQSEADDCEMRLAVGESGSREDGNIIRFYLLVDEEDGLVVDARFQLYGESALFGAGEVLSALVLRKTYFQAMRLTAELIDREVRDNPKTEAFPEEVSAHINLAIEALDIALEKCTDIPVDDTAPPVPFEASKKREGGYPNWKELPINEQREIIETILTEEIRPYIELDAGGVEVLEIKGFDIKIAYQGACTTCYSAIGATLNAISQLLQSHVHPQITVTPDASVLQLD